MEYYDWLKSDFYSIFSYYRVVSRCEYGVIMSGRREDNVLWEYFVDNINIVNAICEKNARLDWVLI